MALITTTSCCKSDAWYVIFPLDAYALGPYRFDELISAKQLVEEVEEQFGEKPSNVWPTGPNPSEEIEEYEFELQGEDDEDN